MLSLVINLLTFNLYPIEQGKICCVKRKGSRIWGKEKILSSHEESNLRPSDSAIQCSTTEPQRLCGDEVYYKVHMTHILHTAGISNVNSIIFVNIIRKMVSFSSWGIKIFFLCPTLMTTSFSILKVLLPVLVILL